MRLNVYIAQATGLSRRGADAVVDEQRVTVNGAAATAGQQVSETDVVTLDGAVIKLRSNHQTLLLHKPVGYVCSRTGQGSKTIYDLLPTELHHLKPVGRLDKTSSGLLIMTSDGQLANELTHPKYQKTKQYQVRLLKNLTLHDQKAIQKGIMLDDGLSHLQLKGSGRDWQVTMQEGRNRQIRRTFAAAGYTVDRLHRTQFGSYVLGSLASGVYTMI